MANIEKKIIVYDIENECPICLNIIDQQDSFIIMTCCNYRIHIQCLINWYSRNSKSNACIMCNQNTIIHESLLGIDDISSSNDVEMNDPETIISIRNMNNLPISFLNNNIIYHYKISGCILFYIFSIIAFILIIILKNNL